MERKYFTLAVASTKKRERERERERDALPLMVVGSEGKKEAKKVIAVIHTYSLMVVVTFSLAFHCAHTDSERVGSGERKSPLAE